MKDSLNFLYETLEIGSYDIHIRSLRNIQEYQDDGNQALKVGIADSTWSISGVLWPSSYVLATIMSRKKIENLKILEVGCGLALAGIISKIRGADITVTDQNPAVKDFLKENIRINHCSEIVFKQALWDHGILDPSIKYDLIIGSDLLYESQHPKDLCEFINHNASRNCKVIIVDPNRGNINFFTKLMKKNDFTHEIDHQEHFERYSLKFKGSVNYYHKNFVE